MPDSFCTDCRTETTPDRAEQIGLMFTQKKGDSRVISVTEQSCGPPISKEGHKSDYRCSRYAGYLFVSARKGIRHSLV